MYCRFVEYFPFFSSLSCRTQGHSDSISVVEQAIEACRAEIDAAAAEGQQPPYFDIMGSLTSELPLQFPFSDEIALELG